MTKGEDAGTEASNPRVEALLDAATELLSLHGLQRTSMEAVAARAGVAKGTAYAHFPGKEALFRAVCARLSARIGEEAEQAAARPGSLERRVSGVLAAKFAPLHRLVHRSPHAEELLGGKGALAGDIAAAGERAFAAQLSGLLAGGEAESAGTRALAGLLLRAADGVARSATSEAALRRDLGKLARLFLRGR